MRFRIFLITLVVFLGIDQPSYSYQLMGDQKQMIRLEGWAQAGYQITQDPALDSLSHEPYLGLMRLVGEGRFHGLGRIFLQVEGNTESLELLDGIAELKPIADLAIRFGKFKVPTSVDFLIFGPTTPFVNRSSLVNMVPTRLVGGEASYSRTFGGLSASMQVGWFMPKSTEKDLLPGGDGNILSLRALIELESGFGFHLAYSDLLLAENHWTNRTPPEGVTTERPIENDRQLDAALIYKRDGWTGYLEGVLVLDSPGSETPYAFYLMVLKNFEIDGSDFTLEPGFRYDHARRNGHTEQRYTVGLTWYLAGDFLCASLNYEFLVRLGQIGHAGYIQLQVGF